MQHSNSGALLVLIGLPGSGKTTWCHTVGPEVTGTVFSLDSARAELGAGSWDQSVTGEAVALTRRRIGEVLATGARATLDATNTHPRDRAAWLDLAGRHTAPVYAVLLDTEAPEAARRNRARLDRTRVPDTAHAAMAHDLAHVTPTALYDEGFSAVYSGTESGLAAVDGGPGDGEQLGDYF